MRFSSLIILLFLSLSATAQWNPCIEESRIQPLYQCNDQFFRPVCGCNNVTYRNECDAFNVHGVNNWISGVCGGVFVELFPNPIGPSSNLNINISHPEFVNANIDLKIVDMYGKVWEQRIINNINQINLQLNVSTLKTGIYVLFVTSSLNTGQVIKFSKF